MFVRCLANNKVIPYERACHFIQVNVHLWHIHLVLTFITQYLRPVACYEETQRENLRTCTNIDYHNVQGSENHPVRIQYLSATYYKAVTIKTSCTLRVVSKQCNSQVPKC